MDSPAARFTAALDGIDPDRVATLLEQVIAGLDWTDPYGEPVDTKPGAVLLASTFGETVHESVEATVGRFTIRYPGPGQQRASGLHLVDAHSQIQAGIADLGESMGSLEDEEDVAELVRRMSLAAAAADQPDGRFKWSGGRLSQAYEVVGEVHRWPGQIQLQAARRYEPEIRIGDELWIDGRELLPVCWVLDWLRG